MASQIPVDHYRPTDQDRLVERWDREGIAEQASANDAVIGERVSWSGWQ